VGGDLPGVATRALQSLVARAAPLAHLLGHGGAYRACAQHPIDDGAAMREVRPDARGAPPGVERAQRACHAPAVQRPTGLLAEQRA